MTPDPDLMSAQPDMMSLAANSYESAAHTVNSVAKATNSVANQLIADWKGKGAIGFHGQMNDLTQYSTAAAESLIGVSATLRTLSSQITAAQNLARQAIALANQTTASSNALDQSYANSVSHNLANLKPNATSEQVAAAYQPTAAQSAQADTLANDAVNAINMMNQANSMARQAWTAATAAFDAITAQSPSMEDAAVSANVKEYDKELPNMELLALISIYGGMDVDYGDGDGDEGDETPDIPESELADAGALGAEIKELEEMEVDGEKVDGQTAADADGGIGVGWSDNVTIMEAWEELLLDPKTAPLLEGSDPFAGNDPGEYNGKYWDPKANGGKGGWIYPPNGGAVPGTVISKVGPSSLTPGEQVSRFGGPGGSYVSPSDTPWADRALPATSLLGGTSSYHVYEVTEKWAEKPPPVIVVQSKVAEAFGQKGGGIQYEFVSKNPAYSHGPPINVGWLVKNGYLKEVTP